MPPDSVSKVAVFLNLYFDRKIKFSSLRSGCQQATLCATDACAGSSPPRSISELFQCKQKDVPKSHVKHSYIQAAPIKVSPSGASNCSIYAQKKVSGTLYELEQSAPIRGCAVSVRTSSEILLKNVFLHSLRTSLTNVAPTDPLMHSINSSRSMEVICFRQQKNHYFIILFIKITGLTEPIVMNRVTLKSNFR